jgi:hypothetical protein
VVSVNRIERFLCDEEILKGHAAPKLSIHGRPGLPAIVAAHPSDLM